MNEQQNVSTQGPSTNTPEPAPRKRPKMSGIKGMVKNLEITELRKQVASLQGQMNSLKNDPQGAVAPLREALEQAVASNNKVVALLAAILDESPEHTITIKRREMEKFVGKAIKLHFDISEDLQEVTASYTLG